MDVGPSEAQLIFAVEKQTKALRRAAGEATVWMQRLRAETDALRPTESIPDVSAEVSLQKVAQSYAAKMADALRQLAAVQDAAGPGITPWRDWQAYSPPETLPATLRLGTFTHGTGDKEYRFPAMLPFLSARNLVIKAQGSLRQKAIHFSKAYTARLLGLIPPGRLQVLLIDPEKLGESLAIFKRIKEARLLIGEEIVHRSTDIEPTLEELSNRLRTLVQDRLQGMYQSIEAYNEGTAVAPEPYRLTVVQNFPEGFTSESVAALVNLMATGPRYGFFTLVTVNTERPLPRDLDLSLLEREAEVIEASGDHFVWRKGTFARYPLTLDEPPSLPHLATFLDEINKAATEHGTMALSFDRYMPPQRDWWTKNAASGLSAPVGMAGDRVINFELGDSPSHAVVIGRSGSGKSNFLHVLISALAAHYSPAELELYLVDLKDGVEFKDYHDRSPLPHATLVASAGDEQFGLSVLERAAQEIHRRSEIFKAAGSGITSLAEYRRRGSETARAKYGRLPRILLIIDEFQKLFGGNFQQADQAGKLLDQVARQGRSMGVHMLLSSQTLAGIPDFGRQILHQMGSHIVFDCDETDAASVLENSAEVRQLTGVKGRALYNAMSGKSGSSTPAQIFLLQPDVRLDHLENLAALARERPGETAATARRYVFDGLSQPALDRYRGELGQLRQAPTDSQRPAGWLGEALTIREQPVEARFERRSGRNLLWVGADARPVMEMATSAILTLAASRPDARFVVVETDSTGTQAGPVFLHGLSSRIGDRLAYVHPENIGQYLEELHEQLAGRAVQAPPVFLVVPGLHLIRALRPANTRDIYADVPPLSQLWLEILENGPELGVHALVWCDTLRNLEKVFVHAPLDLFALRVIQRMSDGDADRLIEAPVGERLKPNQLVFYDSSEAGYRETFRTFALPSEQMLQVALPANPEVKANG